MANVCVASPVVAGVPEEKFKDSNEQQSDLQHLREWIGKQPHLHARTDDKFLLVFLRGCKGSLERTKEKIDAYYSLRSELPEFFAGRDPMAPEIQRILKLGIVLPLGGNACGKRVVMAGRFGTFDPTTIKVTDVCKVMLMLLEVMLEEDEHLHETGIMGFVDYQHVTLAHLTQYTATLLKKMATIYQDAYPLRVKRSDYLNLPVVAEAAINLLKSFMKEKLRNRIHVATKLEDVYEHIPKEMLPMEYGGSAGTLDEITEMWRKKIETRRDFFLDDAQYGVDEKRRSGAPRRFADLFGFEGSFRKLSVD